LAISQFAGRTRVVEQAEGSDEVAFTNAGHHIDLGRRIRIGSRGSSGMMSRVRNINPIFSKVQI